MYEFPGPLFFRQEKESYHSAGPLVERGRNYLQLKDGMLARLLIEMQLGKGGEHRLSGGQCHSGLGLSLADLGLICTSLGFLIDVLKEVTGIL